MPKVSVIIPAYNVEKYLEKAMDSVCSQTLKDIEIICINDGSTDNTDIILKNFANKDSRIKLINFKKSKGQGYARNIGITEAQGEYLMFLDSDDWLAKNACEKAYKHIVSCNADIVSFDNYVYYEKDNKYKIKTYENKPIFTAGIVWRNIYNTNFIKNNNIQFANLHIGEDNVFFVKSIMLAKEMSFIKEPLYYYRKRANSTSITDTSQYCWETITAKEECYNIAKSYPENIYYDESMAYSVNTILSVYKTFNKKISKLSRKKEYYSITKKLLTKIFNELEFSEELNKKIKKHDCRKIIKCNYEQYQILNFLEKIFTIYIQAGILHINILGARIKIKRIF